MQNARVRGKGRGRGPADFYQSSRRAAFGKREEKNGEKEIIERPRAAIDANKALGRTGRVGARARAHALGRNASGNQSSRSR